MLRQRNAVTVAFENYDEVLRLTAEAENSAGLSTQRMTEYTESFAGKSAKLQANLEKLYSTMLDSNVIKFAVDFASALTNIASKLGGWSIILPTVIMLLGAFKKEWVVTKLALGVGNMVIELSTALISGLIPLYVGATDALMGFGLSSAAAATAVSALVTGGIALLITLLPVMFKWLQENNKGFREFFETTKDIKENISDISNEISKLSSELEQLRGKDALTADEVARMNFLQTQLSLQEELLKVEKERLYQRMTREVHVASIGTGNQPGKVEGQLTFGGQQVQADLSDIGDSSKLQAHMEYYEFLKDAAKYISITAEETQYLAKMDAYLAKEAEIVVRKAEEEAGVYSKLTSTMSAFKSSASGIADLYKEQADNGKISIETVMKMIDSGSDMIGLLYVEKGVYKLNKKAAEDYYKTKLAITVNGLKMTKAEIEAEMNKAKAVMLGIKIKSAELAVYELYGKSTSKEQKAAQKIYDDMSKALLQYNNLLAALPKTLDSYVGSQNDVSDAVKKQIDLLEKQKDTAVDAIDAQIEGLKRQLELLKSQNEATQNQIDLQKALDDLERARNQRNTRVYTSTGWQWVSDAGAVSEAEENLKDVQQRMAEKAIQDKIDALENKKEDTENYYDNKIKSLRGYSNGGVVSFTGPAMLHGGPGKEEYVADATETNVLRNMARKLGVTPSARGGLGGGSATNIYGDIIVNGEDNDSLEGIIARATALARVGK